MVVQAVLIHDRFQWAYRMDKQDELMSGGTWQFINVLMRASPRTR